LTDSESLCSGGGKDGISRDLANVTVDEVTEAIERLGRGTLLAKMELSLSRQEPAGHAVEWQGKVR